MAAVSSIGGTSRSSFKAYGSSVGLKAPVVSAHDGMDHAPNVVDMWSMSANVNSFHIAELILSSDTVDEIIG